MLQKKMMVVIIFILSLVLSSCSIERQNSELGNNISVDDVGLNENNDNIIITQSLELKDTTVKTILKLYRQLQKKDEGSLPAFMDPNITWIYEGFQGAVPFAGTFIGIEGVKEFWKAYLRSVIVKKAELRYFVHQGNTVNLHWIEEGIVKVTRKRFIMETAQAWEFNEKGALIKLRWYNDTFALYNAFQLNTDPQLSLVQHSSDYGVIAGTPADPLVVVQNIWSYFFKGDIQGILNSTDQNCTIVFAGPSLNPFAGVRFGHQGWIDFINALYQNYTPKYLDLYKYTIQGGIVDSEWEEIWIAKPTGKEIHIWGIHSWKINSIGKVVSFRSYNDTYWCAWGFMK